MFLCFGQNAQLTFPKIESSNHKRDTKVTLKKEHETDANLYNPKKTYNTTNK